MKHRKVNWNCEEVNMNRRISHMKHRISSLKYEEVNMKHRADKCGEAMTPAAHKSRLRRIKVNVK
jgi:hypothetical protein